MRAVITGPRGQDAWYLLKLLTDKGYDVICPDVDIRDRDKIRKLLLHKPDEFYMLAAKQNIAESFTAPYLYLETNALSVAATLQLTRSVSPETKFFYPSTCEILASDEISCMSTSPYAASKRAAHDICLAMRPPLWIATGIMYNHESMLRKENFVLQKLARGIARFVVTKVPVEIADLDIERDWMHAEDAVRGMWLALQHDKPEDYIFASGETHTVREAAERVCTYFNVALEDAVKVNPQARLLNRRRGPGRPWKAEKLLGWKAERPFSDIILELCVEAERHVKEAA